MELLVSVWIHGCFAFFSATQLCGSWFLWDWPWAPAVKTQILATGLPGNSEFMFKIYIFSIHLYIISSSVWEVKSNDLPLYAWVTGSKELKSSWRVTDYIRPAMSYNILWQRINKWKVIGAYHLRMQKPAWKACCWPNLLQFEHQDE